MYGFLTCHGTACPTWAPSGPTHLHTAYRILESDAAHALSGTHLSAPVGAPAVAGARCHISLRRAPISTHAPTGSGVCARTIARNVIALSRANRYGANRYRANRYGANRYRANRYRAHGNRARQPPEALARDQRALSARTRALSAAPLSTAAALTSRR